jgi:predicted nucleic acid-binding protein
VYASALVALLLDHGTSGWWAAEMLAGRTLSAPTSLPFETANVIRRPELAGSVSADQAAQAHADLLDLPVELWPYEVLASRAWELRHGLSSYDAASVALAELTGGSLVTLDERLAGAAGVRCPIVTPGQSPGPVG